MQQDAVKPALPCVAPSSHTFFSSQCYQTIPMSLCFAGVTVSSNPGNQCSQGLQILCHLWQTGLLNQTGDRLCVPLTFWHRAAESYSDIFPDKFHIHPWKVYQGKSFLCSFQKNIMKSSHWSSLQSEDITSTVFLSISRLVLPLKQIELLSKFSK